MDVDITRVDPTLPLPRYESEGAVGFDLITREDTTIAPGQIGLVPSNIIVKVPEGHVLLITPRSSLPRKKGLVCPHSVGIIDHDYHGPEDEIMVQVQNIRTEPITIERGERIAQGLFVHVDRAEWQETDGHGRESRGGFGSTGSRTDAEDTRYKIQETRDKQETNHNAKISIERIYTKLRNRFSF